MKDTKTALIWITDILKHAQIPFQITGGLAAQAYGSTRDLADIDIEIPEDRFVDIHDAVKDFVTFGPTRYQEKPWDLLLMTLTYKNQAIDISGAYTTNIFDATKNQWTNVKADFSKTLMMNVLGIEMPVTPREDLLSYKKILARNVDIDDIKQIESNGHF